MADNLHEPTKPNVYPPPHRNKMFYSSSARQIKRVTTNLQLTKRTLNPPHPLNRHPIPHSPSCKEKSTSFPM